MASRAGTAASDSLTPRHVAYLGLMHMLGAMVLDGVINFGLTTLMYKGTKSPVMLWSLPNTLAGDAFMTIVIQTTLTWFLDRLAVAADLKKGLVTPLRMPRDAHPWIEWFVGLEQGRRVDYTVGGMGMSQNKSRKEQFIKGFKFHGQRIGVIIVATLIVFWPITILILMVMRSQGIGKDDGPLGGDFNVWPFPQIFKGIYGFATGIITPFVSYIALIYQGESMIRVSSLHSEDEDSAGEEDTMMDDLQQHV
ncbi:hypothetical protein EMPS_10171 [Entomortierella parvispora]|uniref:Uncharacterized protein n=1 Tax=Entomortierella parvispora TaxID=205924 RepID=A0A9P3M128_9FUNG|nr:hypothetical protein EMPS_10171 [Entomortierella parvispora]